MEKLFYMNNRNTLIASSIIYIGKFVRFSIILILYSTIT